MFKKIIRASMTLVGASLAAVISTVSFAQAPAPATAPPPAASASATPQVAKPAIGAHAPLPAGTKINLNTAAANELDTLPGVGKARSKAIMTERAKSPFKDWADFDKRMQHTAVNRGVKAKIKDFATF
jgi:DNA uptake protein ComE-like DNA-binding protein